MRKINLNLAFFTFLFVLNGCTFDTYDKEGVNTVNSQIINGEIGTHSEFPSIVAIMIDNVDVPLCTGTLIRPDLVLTASHCIDHNINTYSVVYGYDDIVKSKMDYLIHLPVLAKYKYQDSFLSGSFNYTDDHKVERYDIPLLERSMNPPSTIGVNDIGLLVIDNSNSPVNIIFSKILPVDYFDEVLNIDDEVVIAGYGLSEHDSSGHQLYYGNVPIKWRGSNEMVVGEKIIDYPDAVGACYGDSGGPAYVEYNGETFVTGVTSRGYDENMGCLSGAIYTVPGYYTDWIDETYKLIKESINGPCDECKDCQLCGQCNQCDECEDDEVTNDVEESDDGGCNISNTNTGSSYIMSVLFLIMAFLFGARKNH